MTTLDKLIDAIKSQAEIFLLDAGEFYPYGTYIDEQGSVIPVGVGSEIEMPESHILMDTLEKYFKSRHDYKLGALAADASLTIKGEKKDAIQIRLFELGEEVTTLYYKYIINKDKVEFTV